MKKSSKPVSIGSVMKDSTKTNSFMAELMKRLEKRQTEQAQKKFEQATFSFKN